MRSMELGMVAMLLLASLSACMNTPERGVTQPITANADIVQLLDYLRQRGVTLQNPEESRAAFLYPVPGVAYRLDSGWLHIHLFPNAQATEQRVNRIPREMTPSVIDWVDKPHFYRCKSTIVLYLGTNVQIMQALTEFCGIEFAGS